jgi:serine phosphatase RsbU (regulator of sigma subunit)
MYTDGVTEACALDQTLFGEDRLLALLAQPVTGATALLDQIVGSVHAHAGQADQADDITLLALRRFPESV